MAKGSGDDTKGIKPVEMSFAQKLKEDKVFLLHMIDDPVKAFRMYGINGDDRMMAMLQGMSANIRQRAVHVLGDIVKMADAKNACDACNACRACKACMTLGSYH